MANEIRPPAAIPPVVGPFKSRQEREAEALRENLKRRKQQQRDRQDQGEPNPDAIEGEQDDSTSAPCDPWAPGRRTDVEA